MQARGFIVHPTYRIEGGRPFVHLYGRLEDGRTFLVRDGRSRPRFYVRSADAARAAALGAGPLSPAGLTTMAGQPVALVEVAIPADVPPLRDRLEAAGVATFEADVRFALRGLIDLGIRGGVLIDGDPRPGRPGAGRAPASPVAGDATRRGPARADGAAGGGGGGHLPGGGATRRSAPRARSWGADGGGVDLVFDDPRLAPDPDGPTPPLEVLSIDIETDPQGLHVLSVALCGCGADEVLLVLPPGRSCPDGVVPFADEAGVLYALARRVRQLDPDILTGWNVIDFDLQVLERAAARGGVPFELGRAPGALRVDPGRGRRGGARASLPGRVVLDGIALLRGAFIPMEEHSLDFVARAVLGEGKLAFEQAPGKGRAEEILSLYERDLATFCAYNRKDAQLVLAILDRLRLIDLTVARSRLTGLPPDRVSASVASVDFLYLSALRRRGAVGPSHIGDEPEAPTAGGHVLEPEPGLYRNVVSFDFKSLYPSLIRTFQIDPLGHARAVAQGADGPDLLRAPSGAAFRREPGILTELLDELFQSREAAKRAGDTVRSHAIKILMNSFYGVLGTSACRFHSPELANAITSLGKEVLLWTKARIERGGRRVLYGDTDSLFVLMGEAAPRAALAAAEALLGELNRDLAAHLRAAHRVESRLELELDRLYLRLLLPHLRGGAAGARKRYAGLALGDGGDGDELVFVGLEAVRRDWTQLARGVQRALYERLFRDEPVEDYLRQAVAELRAGRRDGELVYRKALRKGLGEYTAASPPHVQAARLEEESGGRAGRLVSYVMTTAGPQPAGDRRHPIDHEHYVQKQLRPVAEPVLTLLGLDFDRVIGDDRQLDLF